MIKDKVDGYKRKKFKGYDVVDSYPKDGWLKGYFFVAHEDTKGSEKHDGKTCYRDIESMRHKDYVLHLLNVKPGEKILDVGCGEGPLMVYCGLLGAEAYGQDLSAPAVEKANSYIKSFGIKGKAIVGNAKSLEFPDNYFDKAISGDFFEHVNNKDSIEILKEIKRVLKPNGFLVIRTPNLTYLKFSRYFKMLKRLIKIKNPFDVVITHTTGYSPQHIGLKTKNEMAKIIRSSGFLNFKFYHDINAKLNRISNGIGAVFSELPVLRDIFSEDLIVLIYKPIILSFFPD